MTDEGDRRSLTLGRELLEFSEKGPGFIRPAKPAVDMSQEGEREGFARKAESLLKGGNRVLSPALAPGRPPEHEIRLKGIRERFDGPPGLRLRLSGWPTKRYIQAAAWFGRSEVGLSFRPYSSPAIASEGRPT